MRVTVRNPQYDSRNRYSYHVEEFKTYDGMQVTVPTWAAKGSIALATGDPKFPFRLIDPSIIVKIDDSNFSCVAESLPSDTKTIEVQGSKGKTYIVTISPSSKSCNCPGFSFRKSCKHISNIAS